MNRGKPSCPAGLLQRLVRLGTACQRHRPPTAKTPRTSPRRDPRAARLPRRLIPPPNTQAQPHRPLRDYQPRKAVVRPVSAAAPSSARGVHASTPTPDRESPDHFIPPTIQLPLHYTTLHYTTLQFDFRLYRTTQLSSDGGRVSYTLEKATVPPLSAAAPGSAPPPIATGSGHPDS